MYRKHDDNIYLTGLLGMSKILSVRYVAQFLHNANDFLFWNSEDYFFKIFDCRIFHYLLKQNTKIEVLYLPHYPFPPSSLCACAQSCLISLQPHGLPGSSVHGISQARILEWVAISFSIPPSYHLAIPPRFNVYHTLDLTLHINIPILNPCLAQSISLYLVNK